MSAATSGSITYGPSGMKRSAVRVAAPLCIATIRRCISSTDMSSCASRSPGAHRALDHRVRILDIQGRAGGRPAERRGTRKAVLRRFVGQDDERVADFDLGVRNPALRFETHHFARAERVGVEVDRRGRVCEKMDVREGNIGARAN
jgi:hypothetical protein